MAEAFWEQPDVVDRMAARDPDRDLTDLLGSFHDPAQTRVLDLGSAGGRNTILLARRGFDVWALDASPAMVERTRADLARVLGPEAAAERVRLGPMDDLSAFEDETFALVVAFGIFHNARTWAEWRRAVSETARVLAPGGILLVYHFTPEVDLTGNGVQPVPGEPHTFDGLTHGRCVLLEAAELDAEMARHGLHAARPTETVRLESETSRRVIADARYLREDRQRPPAPEPAG